MRRREFIILLCGATIPWPRVARSEQTGSVRTGILSPLSSSEITSPPFEAFRKALRDFGYLEGKNINFVYRWADGSHERLGEFATELANSKVDVIFTAPEHGEIGAELIENFTEPQAFRAKPSRQRPVTHA